MVSMLHSMHKECHMSMIQCVTFVFSFFIKIQNVLYFEFFVVVFFFFLVSNMW